MRDAVGSLHDNGAGLVEAFAVPERGRDKWRPCVDAETLDRKLGTRGPV